MRWSRRVARGEEGTSLVLALAFMTLFGVFAGLLAQFGAESFKTTSAVRDQRAAVYGAEGAVDTAIDYLRNNTSFGTNGGTCPSVYLPTPSGHTNAYASCTGQVPAVGGVNASLPSQALLTTATGSEDGITVGSVLGLFPGGFDVNGGVFSNSDIQANQSFFGPDVLDAGSNPVSARGSCTGTIRGNPVTCNLGSGSSHPEGNDPNYPSPLSSVPTHRTVPACPSSGNKVISFSPGFYDDEAGLNSLTTGGCHNAVLWFQPGAYYFDFDWRSGDTSATWTIDDATVDVVGGTPKGWSPTNATRPSIPSPGACKTDTDADPNDGIQFVFGGDSRMQGILADIELCATPDANGRELAIYGQKTGALTPTTTTVDPPSGSAGYTSLSSWPTPSSNALISPTDATITTSSTVTRNGSASITARGYPTSSFPTLADFGSVTMKIAHRESLPSNVSSLTATVTANGTACPAINLTPSANGSTDRVETFTGSQLSCINDLSDLSNLTVKYTGKVSNKSGAQSTFSLNGVEFSVTYTPPALRAESGCITQVGSGGCDLVLLSSSFNGAFYVNGTVYAPLARFDLEFGLSTRVQLSRGTIVRSIGLWDPPADSSTTPIISVPASGRTVTFVGYVDSTRRVRAVVNFVDNPTPGAQVDVTSWSVTR
jgi:hypothetical protein